MDKSTFIRDQRIFVLQAIHRVQPEFSPVYTPPQLGYTNALLDTLDKNVLPIEITPSEMVCLPSITNSTNGF